MTRNVESAAQRIVRKHGGHFSAGEWNFANVESKVIADALVKELVDANYQVLRPPVKLNKDGWQVIFR